MASTIGKKRKRPAKAQTKPSKIKRAELSEDSGEDSSESGDAQEEILQLEAEIAESRKHYNNIPKLLSLAKDGDAITSETTLAAIALCRVFCRFFVSEALSLKDSDSQSESTIKRWLKERLDEYIELLSMSLIHGVEEVQSTAMTLGMRLVKEEITYTGSSQWEQGIFQRIMSALRSIETNGEDMRELFGTKYIAPYDDVRYFAMRHIAKRADARIPQGHIESALELLMEVDPAMATSESTNLLVPNVDDETKGLFKLSSARRAVRLAWVALLKSNPSKPERKHVLSIMEERVLPWIGAPEVVLQFLTESFDVGGATSLLALSGLFKIIQERNLDYPAFYQKLYSMLDKDLLHSKHRSRFFRLLDTFLSSTHLPATLVASFIKRLSRLALHAPPAGIVVVVPWIYNMFKLHPQTTYMIHRTARTNSQRESWEENGFEDPFDIYEADPTNTGAIDSSIWEIETLQSHWHPNVATLAKIISEQFTKSNYNMEDFLDHSYNSLLDAEVGKGMKKTPVVEWEIPKHVFTAEDGDGLNQFGKLMNSVLAAV